MCEEINAEGRMQVSIEHDIPQVRVMQCNVLCMYNNIIIILGYGNSIHKVEGINFLCEEINAEGRMHVSIEHGPPQVRVIKYNVVNVFCMLKVMIIFISV